MRLILRAYVQNPLTEPQSLITGLLEKWRTSCTNRKLRKTANILLYRLHFYACKRHIPVKTAAKNKKNCLHSSRKDEEKRFRQVNDLSSLRHVARKAY